MKQHWQNLLSVLPDKANTLYPCIEDLVLTQDFLQPSGDQVTLERQAITQFLCKWLVSAGVSIEHARAWLLEYCVDVLQELSSSSASAIRHSTKSNVKFIYRNTVPFLCGCEENNVNASCSRQCPLYDEMSQVLATQKAFKPNYEVEKVKPVATPRPPSAKEIYKSCYQEMAKLLREKQAAGSNRKDIVRHLNNSGYKTKTGKDWTYSTVGLLIKESRKG